MVRRRYWTEAIECKWSAGSFDASPLLAFRRHYPAGESFVVAADVDAPYRRSVGDFEVEFLSLDDAVGRLSCEPLAGVGAA